MSGCGRGSRLPLLALVFLLLHHSAPAAAQRRSGGASPWKTLAGNEPLVIAKGGHSGLFPDSSAYAYTSAQVASLPNTLFWCDVQLTKDGVGICLPDVKMDNCTTIPDVYRNGKKDYLVNGVNMTGWFSLDYDFANLSQVTLTQAIFSRTPVFDGLFPILAVEQVKQLLGRPRLWLNIQHDMFFSQHNLSMRSYLLSVTRRIVIEYVSSPELSFLRSITARFKGSKTKLVFRFLGADVTEPSTNEAYGSLLKNLTFIKTFASGILVPKSYIWHTTADLYLQPYTSLVLDCHKAGLEIFAADFANDNIIAYNYSYDAIAEYLSFVDNGAFSVDGVLTDAPITASEAIGCYSHINKTASEAGKPVVISHCGASGTYPGCTDRAYQQAIDDGADYIDCPVQVTKDGVLICMNDIDLILGTTVTKSPFNTRSSVIPEIQSRSGIFTFNLTWEEIQTNLKPQTSAPFLEFGLVRNPLYVNAGNFMTLERFLAFAEGKTPAGILISIEHAAFLAENLGLSVTDAVLKALDNSSFNSQPNKVVIQSLDSSVLIKMRKQTKYQLMYRIDKNITDAVSTSITDIAGFADSVAIRRTTVYPVSAAFIVRATDLVGKLQSANLSVYSYLFTNEFVSQPWDFFSDPTAEINTHFQAANVDGIITDFPGTAVAYRKNSCLKLGDNMPAYMLSVRPGSLDDLLQNISPSTMPPALSPGPPLTVADIAEPPLPPAAGNISGPPGGAGSPAAQPPPSGQPSSSASISLCFVAIVGFFFLI